METLDSWHVAREVEKAISEKKKIIVLHEEREQFGGAEKEALVNRVFVTCNNFHKHLLNEVPWIAVDMRIEHSKVMINRILQTCGVIAPNKSLNEILLAVQSHITDRIEDQTFHLANDFHAGTRAWIFDAFHEWSKDSKGNKVFAIVGQAGIGKSTLAAEVVCRAAGTNSQVVAVHYFDYRSRKKQTSAASARDALFSISQQLRNSIPGFRDAMDQQLSHLKDIAEWKTMNELVRYLIAEPAVKLSRSVDVEQPRRIIVLDALDECNEGKEIWKALQNAWKSRDIPAWLGLCVTCRPEIIDFCKTEDEAKRKGITMMRPDEVKNKKDVEIVLKSWIANRADDQVIKKLAELSEGVFLYLRFLKEQLDDMLKNKGTKRITLQDIQLFPSGLSGYYKVYFERLLQVTGGEYFQIILGTILASGSPLPKELWMRACGVTGDLTCDTRLDEPYRQFREALKICKSLLRVPLDMDHETHMGISFIHKSIPDYLTKGDDTEGSAYAQDELRFHVPDNGPGLNALMQEVERLFHDPDCSAGRVSKTYSYRNFFALLCKAKRFDDAKEVLFDLDSFLTWLAGSSSSNEVVQDILRFLTPELIQEADVQVILKLLKLGQRALDTPDVEKKSGKQFPNQLPSQILGRLSEQDVEQRPKLKQLRDSANRYNPGLPWLKPAAASLESALPGGLVQILRGHSDSVQSVAFNHDGTRIVSGSWDKTIRIWDATTGQPIGEPLKGHSSCVKSVALNRDGTRIVSGSWDETIRIWDATTGQPIGEPLKGHSARLNSVAIKTIRIWDATTGQPIGVPLKGYVAEVNSVAFNHDGTRIVSGSFDKTIRIWDATTGQPIGEPLTGHSARVNSVAFNHDGTRIVSGSFDKTIRIWDATTGQPIGEPLKCHSSSVNSVAFNHDGTRIVSGSDDHTIRIWDAVTGQAIGEPLKGHVAQVNSVAFDHDGTRIVSCSKDMTIRIWDAATGQPTGEPLKGPIYYAHSVAFNHDGTQIVSGSEGHTVRIWDVTTGKPIGEPLKSHSARIGSVAFNHDGTRIVSGSFDKTIRIWDATTGQPIGEAMNGHSNSVRMVAFNYDGTRIVSCSWDKTIRIWDATTGQPIGEAMNGHSSPVSSVAFNHDGTRIVSCSEDKTIRIWDAATCQPISEPLKGHSARVNSVAFNHDGTRIVSGSDDHTIRIWDAITGQPIGEPLKVPSGRVGSVAFNHDGTRIVSCFWDKIRIWDAATCQPCGELERIPIAQLARFHTLLPSVFTSHVRFGGSNCIGFTLDHEMPGVAGRVNCRSLVMCVSDSLDQIHILKLVVPS